MTSATPRTIDNLGVDASIRYAKDQSTVERRFIEESLLIPQKTEISRTTPSALSEFDQFFSADKKIPWALFEPPPNYLSTQRTLFSYQLLPSLGEYEKMEADIDKLDSLGDALDKERKESRQSLQEAMEEQNEQEKERQMLMALFHCIHKLDKVLGIVNARRNQYQRG